MSGRDRNCSPELEVLGVRASAGAGKTYRLSLRYLKLLKGAGEPCPENLRRIVAITAIAFRNLLFTLSIIFVVYITCLISIGYLKNVINASQLASQLFTTCAPFGRKNL